MDIKRNGKEKEYNEYGQIIFEGEYINDQKRRGKEYVNNRLEFEGEYLSNKKFHGKGYDINGKIIYELINGNGKVIEYDNKGNIQFEGQYLNGKKNGKGREYKNGQLIYDGEYKNDKKLKKIIIIIIIIIGLFISII